MVKWNRQTCMCVLLTGAVLWWRSFWAWTSRTKIWICNASWKRSSCPLLERCWAAGEMLCSCSSVVCSSHLIPSVVSLSRELALSGVTWLKCYYSNVWTFGILCGLQWFVLQKQNTHLNVFLCFKFHFKKHMWSKRTWFMWLLSKQCFLIQWSITQKSFSFI